MHWVHGDYTLRWDHIRDTLVNPGWGYVMTLAGTNNTGVTRWVRIFGAQYYLNGAGTQLGNDMIAELQRGTAMCVINEMTRPGAHSGDSRWTIYLASVALGFNFPGKWGTYIMPGKTVDYLNDIEAPGCPEYPARFDPLANVIIRGGWTLPELYVTLPEYLSGGDGYVRNIIQGGGGVAPNRVNWLANLRAYWYNNGWWFAAAAKICPVIAVSDSWLGSTGGPAGQAARLLDRIWFVGATQTAYPSLWTVVEEAGGPGSYLWTGTGPNLVTPLTRDEVFGASHRWYAQGLNQSSRLGNV